MENKLITPHEYIIPKFYVPRRYFVGGIVVVSEPDLSMKLTEEMYHIKRIIKDILKKHCK